MNELELLELNRRKRREVRLEADERISAHSGPRSKPSPRRVSDLKRNDVKRIIKEAVARTDFKAIADAAVKNIDLTKVIRASVLLSIAKLRGKVE